MLYNEKLKNLRERVGLTHVEISSMLNLKDDAYGQYEREYVIIPIKHLNTLSNFYNVSLDYIFGFTTTIQYKNKRNELDKKLSSIRIKELRHENKLTQEKLAKILNISRTAITEYERGTNTIATPFLYTICSKYHISADYLLGKIDAPKNF